MSSGITDCAKCGGEMVIGFIPDMGGAGYLPARWVEGVPEHSVLKGTKVSGKTQLTIRANRCQKCGFVELYANEPFEKP